MIRLRMLCLAALMLAAIPTFAQESACPLVTPEEASKVLGAAVEQLPVGKSCLYRLKDSRLAMVVRVSKESAESIRLMKENIVKHGGSVQDEPALGTGAYSATRHDSNRVYAFKNGQMLMIDVTDSSKAAIPEGTVAKLRDLAKKALGRF